MGCGEIALNSKPLNPKPQVECLGLSWICDDYDLRDPNILRQVPFMDFRVLGSFRA